MLYNPGAVFTLDVCCRRSHHHPALARKYFIVYPRRLVMSHAWTVHSVRSSLSSSQRSKVDSLVFTPPPALHLVPALHTSPLRWGYFIPFAAFVFMLLAARLLCPIPPSAPSPVYVFDWPV
ncbi:unnamed protein product, partial [Pylaiella littoralis]